MMLSLRVFPGDLDHFTRIFYHTRNRMISIFTSNIFSYFLFIRLPRRSKREEISEKRRRFRFMIWLIMMFFFKFLLILTKIEVTID